MTGRASLARWLRSQIEAHRLGLPRLGRWRTLALAGLLAMLLAGNASATAPPGAVKVEEDWVIEIGTPDVSLEGPQITTAMSSTELLADVHMVFEVNTRTWPSYQPGGMQLQCWSGDMYLVHKNNNKSGLLYNPGEVVRYTTSMRITGGRVVFDVLNGSSTTWGTFGISGALKAELETPQSGLGRYSPEISVRNSRVGYGGHMVNKFYIKEVRYYDSANNLILTDPTVRVVHGATGS